MTRTTKEIADDFNARQSAVHDFGVPQSTKADPMTQTFSAETFRDLGEEVDDNGLLLVTSMDQIEVVRTALRIAEHVMEASLIEASIHNATTDLGAMEALRIGQLVREALTKP